MSLLDKVPVNVVSQLQRKANRLIGQPAQLFDYLKNQWQQGVSDIWDSESPQAVLDAIGEHGAELFDLSAKTVGFLEQLKPGCTADTVVKIRPFTINQDGSVKIN